MSKFVSLALLMALASPVLADEEAAAAGDAVRAFEATRASVVEDLSRNVERLFLVRPDGWAVRSTNLDKAAS